MNQEKSDVEFAEEIKNLGGDNVSLLLWKFFADHKGQDWTDLNLLDFQIWLRGEK